MLTCYKRYISDITEEVNSLEGIHTGNSTIDALIGSKSAIAKKKNIPVECEIDIPEKLYIREDHLVVVLGNLYDNAIDASENVPPENRFIRIKIVSREEELLICFENATKETQSEKKTRWETTKQNKFVHGFGIKNIDRIVKLYDGNSYRKIDNNVFNCWINMPNKK